MNCFFEECGNDASQEWRGMYLCEDHISEPEFIDDLYEKIKRSSPNKSFDSFIHTLSQCPSLNSGVSLTPEKVTLDYMSYQDYFNVKFFAGYIRMMRVLLGYDPMIEFKIGMFKLWLFDHWGDIYPDADTKQSLRVYRTDPGKLAKKEQDKRLSKPCVYILESADIPGVYKIGMAKNLKHRLDAYSTHNPNKPTLVHVFYTENAKWLEDELHRQFSGKRTHGEWFRLNDEDVIDAIDMGNQLALPGGAS